MDKYDFRERIQFVISIQSVYAISPWLDQYDGLSAQPVPPKMHAPLASGTDGREYFTVHAVHSYSGDKM